MCPHQGLSLLLARCEVVWRETAWLTFVPAWLASAALAPRANIATAATVAARRVVIDRGKRVMMGRW